jgi:hypothetical protein
VGSGGVACGGDVMSNHTPGPWRVIGLGYAIYQVEKHTETASFSSFSEQSEANARLIAAAPDLLEALQGLLTDIVEYQTINNLGGENNHWQVIARAAIAKATGGQP